MVMHWRFGDLLLYFFILLIFSNKGDEKFVFLYFFSKREEVEADERPGEASAWSDMPAGPGE